MKSSEIGGEPSVQGELIAETASNFSDDSYYKSLDTFYSLRDSAVSGTVTQAINGESAMGSIRAWAVRPLDQRPIAVACRHHQQLWPARKPYHPKRGR